MAYLHKHVRRVTWGWWSWDMILGEILNRPPIGTLATRDAWARAVIAIAS